MRIFFRWLVRLTASHFLTVRVNEHSLLPLMLEQFPFLYVSDPTLTKMWKQQMAQVEQLKREAQRENRSKKKLQDEVSSCPSRWESLPSAAWLTSLFCVFLKIEEALRRHDLLTALVKKEYDHNQRLVCQEHTEPCRFLYRRQAADFYNTCPWEWMGIRL